MDHALLAPSSSSRWLVCPPSARLELQFPEEVESDFAREGTLAHSIAEALLKNYLKNDILVLDLAEWQKFKLTEFYTEAMYEHAKDFAIYVTGYLIGSKDKLFVEINLDLTRWIPEGFGHSDASVLQVNEKHLHVFDLKFGKGVLVDAKDNKQLKIYALGVIEWLDFFGYDIEFITLHIYQPRMQNNPTFHISYEELMAWGETELKPQAEIAFSGEGEFKAGKHCLFCKAMPACRALADYNLEIAKHDFTEPALLEDHEIIEVYERQSIFESWLKSIKEYMLARALKGEGWTGYKIVEGKSNRIYKDQDLVARTLINNLNFGYVSEIYKPKELLGITELTKKLGADNFKKYVEPLLLKPKGAPALAPLSDTRQIYNSAESDFSDSWFDPMEL